MTDAYETTLRRQIKADREALRTLKVRIETREESLRSYLATTGRSLLVGAEAHAPVPTPSARRAAYMHVLRNEPPGEVMRAGEIRSRAAPLLNGYEPSQDMISRDMDRARDDGLVESPTKGYWRLAPASVRP